MQIQKNSFNNDGKLPDHSLMKYKPVFELLQNLHLLIYTGQFMTI